MQAIGTSIATKNIDNNIPVYCKGNPSPNTMIAE